MSEIGPGTVVRQSGDTVSREVGDQIVLLTPGGGTVHELDEVGCFIWSLCAEPASVEAITAKIVAAYEVEAETAERDLILFLKELIDHGAVIKQ